MDRKTLLDLGWQLSQDMAKLLTQQLHDRKAVEQEQINDVENHLEVIELLLSQLSWKA